MKIEFSKHEGLITLAAHKRIGLWASQILLRGSRVVRTGGRLSHASTHGLLTVALLNTINGISRNQALKLSPPGGKMRLVVLTSDAAFVDGINAMVRNSQPEKLRSGRNFTSTLMRKLERFDITAMLPEPDDKSVLVLGNWLAVNAFDTKRANDLPQSIAPNLVSQVL